MNLKFKAIGYARWAVELNDAWYEIVSTAGPEWELKPYVEPEIEAPLFAVSASYHSVFPPLPASPVDHCQNLLAQNVAALDQVKRDLEVEKKISERFLEGIRSSNERDE